MNSPISGSMGIRTIGSGSMRQLSVTRPYDFSNRGQNLMVSTPQPPGSFRPEHSYIRRASSPMIPQTSSGYMSDSQYEDDMRKISLIRSVDQLVINKQQALQILYGDLSIIRRESYLCHPVDPSISHYSLVLHRLSCIDRKTFDSKFYELDQISRNTNHPNVLRIFSFWSEDSPDAFSYKSLIVLQEYSQYTMREYIQQYMNAHDLTTIPESLLIRIGCDISNALETLHQSNVSHCGVREYNTYVRIDESLFEASDLEVPEPSMVTFCISLPWRAEMDVMCTPSLDSQAGNTYNRTSFSQMLSSTLVKKAPDTIYIQKEAELRNNPEASTPNSPKRKMKRTSRPETPNDKSSSPSDGFSSLPTLSALSNYFNLDLYSLGILIVKVIEMYGPDELKEMEAPLQLLAKEKPYVKELQKAYPNLVASLTLLLNIYEEEQTVDTVISSGNIHSLFATYFAVVIQRNYRSSLVKRDRKLIVASATVIQCEYRRHLYSKRFQVYRVSVLRSNAHTLQAMVRALPNRLYFEEYVASTVRIQALMRRILARRYYLINRRLAVMIQRIFRGRYTRKLIFSWKIQLDNRKKQMESLGSILASTDVDTVTINPYYPRDISNEEEEGILYPAKYKVYKNVGSYFKAYPDKFPFIENADRDAKIIEGLKKKNAELEAALKKAHNDYERLKAEVNQKNESVGIFLDEYMKYEKQLRSKYEKYYVSSRYSSPIPYKVEPVNYTAWEKLHDTLNVVENVMRDDSSVFTRKDATIKLSFEPSIVTKIRIHPGEPGPLHLKLVITAADEHDIFVDNYELGRSVMDIDIAAINVTKASFTFKDNIRGGSICSIRFIEIIGVLMPDFV